ncbi:MAG: AgmX/PglI C-terminal domain-containing protein [Polyangiaceae bacterium]|nr:AgmX/PglI C-terminal domain-containing protein [Polyangiaceae bacterium]
MTRFAAQRREQASLSPLFWLLFLAAWLVACGPAEEALAPDSTTWAELRTVRRGLTVELPSAGARASYPRERLVDGTVVRVEGGGLGWIRLDGGTTLLVRGPARLRQRPMAVELEQGRVFVDVPPGTSMELATPQGPLTLTAVRASVEVDPAGPVEAYVLRGEVRSRAARARSGERLRVDQGTAEVVAAVAWEDWTGGLATTDRAPAAVPFGIGTVGARKPGDQGQVRFPLAIQRLVVKVDVKGDLAFTEVEETFFNPSSDLVEGLYGFRTPLGATLERFGVDRGGRIVWGHVKEKQVAATQYQSHVYQGSTEDPALLEWDAPGVYRARLYPIQAGETRRVVVRYSEWLGRTGAKGELRLYVFPMAAEGAEESLPRIEELTFTMSLRGAGSKTVRTGMAGVRRGDELIVRAQDLIPRSDLAVELFDAGQAQMKGYRAKHRIAVDSLPMDERAAAAKLAAGESDYLLVPVRAAEVPLAEGGLDLAIVVDASAATDEAALALARATTGALLAHLSSEDRVAVWAGADTLRPLTPRSGKLTPVDAALRSELGAALARVEPGGATDLGTMLGDAAVALDPKRRGAVVYIGDGRPTVGELGLEGLRQRLAKLPRPVRVYALAVGLGADLQILGGLARGGFVARVEDGFGAARQALELFEHAERPAWLGANVDLGPAVERVYPRDTSTWVADESVLVVGRLAGREAPRVIHLGGPTGQREVALSVQPLDDRGDASRRWGLGRLAQLLDEEAGQAAMVDLGSRQGLITPMTSFYVPTTSELMSDYAGNAPGTEREPRPAVKPGFFERLFGNTKSERSSDAPLLASASGLSDEDRENVVYEVNADNREGGTGTRAKDGTITSTPSRRRFSVGRPADAPIATAAPESELTRAAAARGASEFGMVGAVEAKAGEGPPAVSRPRVATQPATADPNVPTTSRSRDTSGSSVSSGALGKMADAAQEDLAGPADGVGLSANGKGGDGLGDIVSGGNATVSGQGFGSGHGRLGAGHHTAVPIVRMGATEITGRLPSEVVQRVVRQQYGRFRMCYEQGLARNPNLQGRVSVRFRISADGSVAAPENGGSDLPDPGVISCVLGVYSRLTFPAPEGGVATVVYPILLAPGARAAPRQDDVAATYLVRVLPRVPLFCGDAAKVTLEERALLWRERLAQVRDRAPAIAAAYSRALRDCEATTPRERSRLLALMLDAVSTTRGQVQLYQVMQDQMGAADILYRGILARAKTAAQIRELHEALGLTFMDPGILAKAIADAKEPSARVRKLRALREEFPDDLVLALRLLDALEDADELAAARSLARELRARSDADAAVRTAVGELSLRLAERATKADEKASSLGDARRAFGEIVEFAPTDPVARRRLGDLLRAHGWYAEARRQYETLAALTPDDASVALLVAAAAEGEGRLEEAVRWTEKGIDAGAPDVAQGPAVTARVFASTFLAWGRFHASKAEKAKEREALMARARRLVKEPATKSARVTLTFTHPDFHPTLWSNALGAPMPAATGDLMLGIAEAVVPLRDDAFAEVRVDPAELEAAGRLGVEALLTVVFAELEPEERIVRVPIRYTRDTAAVQRFALRGQEVTRG